jgi:hypothetical protein
MVTAPLSGRNSDADLSRLKFCFGLAKGPWLAVPFPHVRKPRGDAAVFSDNLIASVAQLAEQLTLNFERGFRQNYLTLSRLTNIGFPTDVVISVSPNNAPKSSRGITFGMQWQAAPGRGLFCDGNGYTGTGDGSNNARLFFFSVIEIPCAGVWTALSLTRRRWRHTARFSQHGGRYRNKPPASIAARTRKSCSLSPVISSVACIIAISSFDFSAE